MHNEPSREKHFKYFAAPCLFSVVDNRLMVFDSSINVRAQLVYNKHLGHLTFPNHYGSSCVD